MEFYGDLKPEKDKVIKELSVFVEYLEKEYGVKPIIYSTTPFYNKYLSDTFSDCPLWIRTYILLAWKKGPEKYIDMNVFYGDYRELKKYTIKPASE